jgi:hypothetical protein
MKFCEFENIIVKFKDGTEWAVPIEVIAINRADWYKDEFGDDIERSLNEDTIPLFEESLYEILDWFTNNMDWKDVEKFAVKREVKPIPFNYHAGFSSCEMDFE